MLLVLGDNNIVFKKSIIEGRKTTKDKRLLGHTFKQTRRLLLASVPLLWSSLTFAADERPNVVVLFVDDAGYSDFSGFGGEADMPALDSLADIGLKMTNFRTMPTCSPSRSVLLSGVDNHLNGLGTMQGQLRNPANPQRGNPGYEGYMNKQVVSIARLLKDSGYHTYMTGKWHLGIEEEIDGGQTLFNDGWWPKDRGFEHSYGMLEGGGEHFGSCEREEGHCTRFFEDDTIITRDLPADYFSGYAHTQKAIEFINRGITQDNGERKPFFLYYADTMVHEPLQIPDDYIQRGMDKYYNLYLTKGWDGIRQDRFDRMIAANLIPAGSTLHDRHRTLPAWNDESDPKWANELRLVADQAADPANNVPHIPYGEMWLGSDGQKITTVAELKKTLAKKMAIYTSMLEFYDDRVGDIITFLKQSGEYENTVFFYVSDNGGEARQVDFSTRHSMYRRGIDNSFANLGRRGSFVSNGRGWAEANNAPLWGTKALVTEGGSRVPALMAYPKQAIAGGKTSTALTHVSDIPTTILKYANVEHPVGVVDQPSHANCTGTYAERTNVCPVNGKDLSGLYAGETNSVRAGEPLAMEIFGYQNQALWMENAAGETWKIVKSGLGTGYGNPLSEPWRIFNLSQNISEHPANDLAASEPAKLKEMIAMYNTYERNVGVVGLRSPTKAGDEAVEPNTEAVYTINVANKSDQPDTFAIACHSAWECALSTESTTARGDTGLLAVTPETTLTLAGNESASLNVILQVPASTNKDKPNNTVVEVNSDANPQYSFTEILITRAAKTVTEEASAGNDSNNGGGGSFSIEVLLMLLFGSATIMVIRRKRQ